MPMLSRSRTRIARTAALALLLFSTACANDEPAAPDASPGDDTALQVSVITFGITLDKLTAEVTGPGISVPLVFNLTLANDVATGTLRLPPGEDRTITLKAYDETGLVSHEGSTTIDVRPGTNPTVAITLRSRAGQVPIQGTISSFGMQVDGLDFLTVGSSSGFTARLFGTNGVELPLPAAEVEWAVSNPAFASVTPTGVVTGLVPGTVLVVATWQGLAAVRSVNVIPVP